MPRTTLALTSFIAGEFSPKLSGRTDFEKYSSGAKTLENMMVHPQGMASRRIGTQFVSEVKTSSLKTRLIPFEFSTTQTYMLEFGNQYIRFFKDKGQILEGDITISGITKANPGVVTATAHGYSNGDFVVISSVVGMTQVNNKTFKVSNKATNTFELQDVDGSNVDTSGYSTYSSAGTANKIYQITTNYLTAELFQIKVAQSADVLFITHPNHEVSKLERTGHTSWTLSEVSFTKGPFLTENSTSVTLTTSATTVGSGRTLTASSSLFASTDVGRQVELGDGWGTITGYTSGTVVTWTITEAATGSGGTEWSLGAFSDTTGFPSATCFFEQRLIFSGTNTEPQTLYFSKSGDYENMTSGTEAADAMVYTIASNQVNAIRYLKSQRTLVIGTTGGEYTLSAEGTGAAVTPTNITIKKQSSYGSANVDALTVGNAVIFLQRAKRKLRELAYNFDQDSYTAPDLTILNDVVTESGINEMEYQQSPDSIIWCVRDDGVLGSLCYQRSENVVAWTRHKLGGHFGECTITVTDYSGISTATKLKLTKSDGTSVTFTSEASGGTAPDETLGFRPNQDNDTTADNIFTAINAHEDFTVENPASNVVTVRETTHSAGLLTITSTDDVRLAVTSEGNSVVESIASISGSLNEDELWCTCKRTINGTTRRYVEVFSDFDFDETDSEVFHFLDSGLSYDGTATTSITGLEHLEGETVTILADGATHATKTVSSGGITLDRSSKKVKVGLAYSSILQTMRLDGGAAEYAGTAQSKIKRISKVTLRLFNTVGAKVGNSLTNLDTIPFRTSSDPLDTPVSTFLEGDKVIEFPGDYDSDAYIVVKQDQCLPLSVLAIYPELVTHD